ncbi:MAG: hypothetical protein WD399_08100 [Thermoleophilaceae bacterium]
MPAVAGATTREAHYDGGTGSASGPLVIAEANASYESAGTISLSMRFAEPARDPLPAGTTLEWIVSSSGGSPSTSCRPGVTGDIRATAVHAEGSTPAWNASYAVTGRPTTEVRGFSLELSPDRRTATAEIADGLIAGRGYRCMRASSTYPSPVSYDTTGRVPFRLPLTELAIVRKVQLRKSSKRPGHTVVRVRATGDARLAIKLLRRGKPVYRRKLESRGGTTFKKRFKWSCRRTGVFRLVVTARDSYGNRMTERRRWKVSARRCKRLRAAEHRAAERRAARRRAQRERERAKEPECAPGYSPCLPVVGDLDCGDISDSLKPIRVYGDDPYGLDGDNDGLGCES